MMRRTRLRNGGGGNVRHGKMLVCRNKNREKRGTKKGFFSTCFSTRDGKIMHVYTFNMHSYELLMMVLLIGIALLYPDKRINLDKR
jgi:hypothetical protein